MLPRFLGWLLLLVGAAVFAIRLQHAGPYALPGGGNLFGGVAALLLGALLVGRWLDRDRSAAPLRWLAFATIPVVLYLALYATMAEIEEVVVLEATDPAGGTTGLRLWIVDADGAAWVTMRRSKADANDLRETRARLFRNGESRCVIATRFEDPGTVNRIHQLRHEKYAVQRFATVLGLFSESPGADTVALRLDPCPPS